MNIIIIIVGAIGSINATAPPPLSFNPVEG